MKKRWLLLIATLLIMPTLVFAKSSEGMTTQGMLSYSFIISLIHVSFIITPIRTLIKKMTASQVEKKEQVLTFIIVFFVNFMFLGMLGYTWVSLSFILIFLVGVPCMLISAARTTRLSSTELSGLDPSKTIPGYIKTVVIKCTKCHAVLNVNDKFCPNCGAEFEGDNAKVESVSKEDMPLKLNELDPMYSKPEDELISEIIEETMKELDFDINTKLIPSAEKIRINILNIIFSILLFLYIGLIFYHVQYFVYVAGFIILICFFVYKCNINLKKYILKQIKSRPSENIDNIIGSIKETMVPKHTFITGLILPILVVIAGVALFKNPIIFYEEVEDGYAVRYYFTGWSSLSYASIPEEYNGKPVVSLRGNAFSNLPLLIEVYLPDSITEIRGEAFKNDYALEKVHLSSKLKYLGGESFYSCYSLKEINLTYETPLEEIKGDTFEECHSLKEITIPDTVTRIGGHAFYNDYNLSVVNISNNSILNEIGSSAFRKCLSLTKISIPNDTSVESNSFKESPTTVNRFISDKFKENSVGSIQSFALLLNHYQNLNVPGNGDITFTNISFDARTKVHKISISGYKNESIAFSKTYKYRFNDYYYIEFVPADSSATVYCYIKAYE